MKQKIILTISLLFSILSSFAQPTLSGADCNMVIGDNFNYRSSSVYLGKATGINYTWDFTSYDTTLNSIVNTNVQSSGITNILLDVEPGIYDIRTRYEVLPTKLELQGYTVTNGDNVTYGDTWLKLVYPMTMGTSFSDTYKSSGSFNGGQAIVKISGTSNTIADGWGTLKTPYGTYNNVLHLTTLTQYLDTINFNYPGVGYDTTHNWYIAGVHKPLLTTYSQSHVTGAATPTYYQETTFLISSPTSLNESPSAVYDKLEIYPNPSYGNFDVRTNSNINENLNFKMLDVRGKDIHVDFHLKSSNVYSIEHSASAGIYFLMVYEKDQIVAIRKITVY